MRVFFSRGWWLVFPNGKPIAKFKDELDAVDYACTKARKPSSKDRLVFVFDKKDGRILKRIQT